jgi:acetylornithine deacetylase/succinyl-diaminopimelate desuccinylase-like protein
MLIYDEIFSKVKTLMPDIIKDLKTLIEIPSVAFPGYPSEPVNKMATATIAMLKHYGLQNAHLINITGGYPAIYGEIPAPPNMPTIMLYAHYDVQPANKDDGWKTDPWTPVEKDGRIYGRGATDDKSGIAIIAASIKLFDGNLPIGIKVLIEGEEETSDRLGNFARTNPQLFQCDAFIIVDTENLTTEIPNLTTTLRGEVSCIVDVQTLNHPVHSGEFGGVAPDALICLIKILATLHDANGDVAIKNLTMDGQESRHYPEEIFREGAGILDDVGLIGTGSISSRLWSKPSVTVIGIDAPTISSSSNIIIPRASAKISMRISPIADASQELQHLIDHINAVVPWNAHVKITKVSESSGFICSLNGPAYQAASNAMEIAFKKSPKDIGSGGSIPLLHMIRNIVPQAEFILWGAEEISNSRIHGTDESVSINMLEKMIITQSLFYMMLHKKNSIDIRNNNEGMPL